VVKYLRAEKAKEFVFERDRCGEDAVKALKSFIPFLLFKER
jgi:hypothetical protein